MILIRPEITGGEMIAKEINLKKKIEELHFYYKKCKGSNRLKKSNITDKRRNSRKS